MAELIGTEQPDLLLVNDDDLAYAKIRLDERSLATALGSRGPSPARSPGHWSWPARGT